MWRLAVLIVGVVVIIALLVALFVAQLRPSGAPRARDVSTGTLPDGLPAWTENTVTTTPLANVPSWGSESIAVAPAFASYYAAHAGSVRLGAALTLAFPTANGLVQIFANGALMQTLAPANALSNPVSTGPFGIAVAASTRESDAPVVEVPVGVALLARGSLAAVTAPGALATSLTYADLRAAARPAVLTRQSTGCATGETFEPVAEGGTHALGHCVPAATWAYMQNAQVFPDGWLTDVGLPLTEALPATISQGGTATPVLVQAFRDAVLITPAAPTNESAGAPSGVTLVPTGLAFLETFGPPTALAGPLRPAWVTRLEAIQNAPGGQSLITLGANYPVVLSDSRWVGTHLWYAVYYSAVAGNGIGWLPAAQLTFTAPPSGVAGAAWAGIDALSPSLASYLRAQGTSIGVTVYDVGRNTYFTYNGDGRFIMGSSAKIPILFTFLNAEEREGATPTGDDIERMTVMIELSDNNAMQYYYDMFDDGPPIVAYLKTLGVTAYTPLQGEPGWSTFTPSAMVQLLLDLEQGQILTAHDRAFVISLMEHVVSYQQMGVGQTAPAGSTYAMKDGWVIGPDNLWYANSSGIVFAKHDTYIISVYDGQQYSLDTAYSMLNTTCGQVAKVLGS